MIIAIIVQLSSDDFEQSILGLGFNSDVISALVAIHQSNHDDIRAYLQQTTMGLPAYQDLEWRLDVQVENGRLCVCVFLGGRGRVWIV